MAIADRKAKARKITHRTEQSQPFAEIDAKQLRRAQKDPGIQQLHAAADRHLEQLQAEGRISL